MREYVISGTLSFKEKEGTSEISNVGFSFISNREGFAPTNRTASDSLGRVLGDKIFEGITKYENPNSVNPILEHIRQLEEEFVNGG